MQVSGNQAQEGRRTYARARLWLGISGVGFWVVLAVAALLGGWPRALPGPEAPLTTQIGGLAVALLLYAAIELPFDLFGGYLLPTRHGRSTQSLSTFFRRWSRGIAWKLASWLVIGSLILGAGRAFGWAGAFAAVIVATVALILGQGFLARQVGGMKQCASGLADLRQDLSRTELEIPRTVFYDSRDPGFTGGIIGRPGAETLVLPEAWRIELGESGLTAAALRRIVALRRGGRARGLWTAVCWNLLGFVAATQLPGAGVESASQLVATSFGATLWSFLGVLILPSLSRPAVQLSDVQALELGVDRETLGKALRRLDQLQDDEPSRARWIERIFHPIPSLESRAEFIRRASDSGMPNATDAWNTARLSLFLSWSTLGLLSHAVHCNSGRPELWVLLPTD